MPVIQQGVINTTALAVPDLYVQIVPPQNLLLNGVPTDVVGIVGSASWGPVGTPVIVSTMTDYAQNFGPVMPRLHDMGTHVATAVLQGAQNFRCVRATDGTDFAACSLVPGTNVSVTALYTGRLGNSIVATLRPGNRSNSWTLAIALNANPLEVFDNITGDGAAFWLNLADAVNGGQGLARGPSKLVRMDAGGTIAAPASVEFTLGNQTQGSDGASNLTDRHLLGADTHLATGMYALRGQQCNIALLSDACDPVYWPQQVQFGIQEGVYIVLTGQAGESIADAMARKSSASIDHYTAKVLFGDWLWWSDQTNATTRLVSPQGFMAGRLANLSPERSSLNKQVWGVVGSQASGLPGTGQTTAYSTAQLAALFGAGIDLICKPQPGGDYWGARAGHNSSLDQSVNGDNYTRLTNYISSSLAAGMGRFVGQPITNDLFRNIRATLLSFLTNMQSQGLLGAFGKATPFSVICDATNNLSSRTALGYVQADVQVRYLAINERFLVNVEGGQTVQVYQRASSSNITT